MSTQPLAFTGVSQFSADFQTILSRAKQIASLPITGLQNDQAKLLTQKQLLTNLNGVVASLGSKVAALGTVGEQRALAASSSDTSKAAVISTAASAPATYTIGNITSIAHGASATSAGYTTGDTTQVSASGTVRLTFQGVDHDITLTAQENNLAGLRDKINALGVGLTATVLTTGTGDTPYYLSITSNAFGEKPIALVEDPLGAATSLLAYNDDGANTEFEINGVAVSKASTVINDVVPGLTFSIEGTTTGAETVSLTLATNRSQISNAVKDLVSAYNTTAAAVDAQIGPAAGLLSGSNIVREVSGALRELTGYRGSGSVASLGDLGLELSATGEASFNQATFDALSDSQIGAALDLLGSATSGLGGLASRFTQISDPVTGLIALQQRQYDRTDQQITDHIAVLTERVNALQLSVSSRLQAADALLARLESQQTVLDASLKGLALTLYGKQNQ